MATPSSANISITINGVDYTVDHKNFSALTMKRTVSDVCNSFTLNILDNATFDIEKALLAGCNDIEIKYIDDSRGIYKTLKGSVLKIKNSFVDNRNMLTIEGFVSVNVHQKYQTQSMNWNKVPKFNWNDIDKTMFSKYTKSISESDSVESIQRELEDEYNNLMKQYEVQDSFRKNNQPNFYNMSTPISLKLQNNTFANMTKREADKVDTQASAPDILGKIFNQSNGIYIDSEGNYYLNPGYFYSDSIENGGSKRYEPLRSSGTITVPMKPSKIMALIFFGGEYKDLLSTNLKDYKNTALYSGDESINAMDWYFIKLWYAKMGIREAINSSYVKVGNWDNTDFVTDDLTQTKQSYYNYIYDNLLTKCVRTSSSGKESNFYIKIDGNNVSLERINATAAAKADTKATYVYYGAFEKSANQGVLTSFSAKLNVLTSMITNGNNTSEDGDISQMNLVTGENNEATIVDESDDSGDLPEVLYVPVWGAVTYAITASNSKSSFTNIVDVFNRARNNCYTATATIEGFNTLEPLDFIDIVIVPKSTTNGGQFLHHTSGRYYIQAIEDKIEGGIFTSNISLIKNIQSAGATKVIFSTSSIAWVKSGKGSSGAGHGGGGGRGF